MAPIKPRVYKFRASIDAFPEDAWREFEILSCATIRQLVAAVLGVFESRQMRPWYVRDGDTAFEYLGPTGQDCWPELDDIETEDPEFTQLRELKLTRKRQLKMRFDEEYCWDFTIQLLGTRQLPEGVNSNDYPKFVDGVGAPIMDCYEPEFVTNVIRAQKLGMDTEHDIRFYLILPDRFLKWHYDYYDRENLPKEFRRLYLRRQLREHGADPMQLYAADEDPLLSVPKV